MNHNIVKEKRSYSTNVRNPEFFPRIRKSPTVSSSKSIFHEISAYLNKEFKMKVNLVKVAKRMETVCCESNRVRSNREQRSIDIIDRWKKKSRERKSIHPKSLIKIGDLKKQKLSAS